MSPKGSIFPGRDDSSHQSSADAICRFGGVGFCCSVMTMIHFWDLMLRSHQALKSLCKHTYMHVLGFCIQNSCVKASV